MSDNTLVSIAVPAFNPEFFPRTLQSALIQDYPNLEIVVCDDRPDDRIKAQFDELTASTDKVVRYVRNERTLGFSGNVLRCYEQSRGSMVKLLCDDDVLTPDCISRQARALLDFEQAAFAWSRRLLSGADDTLLPSRVGNNPLFTEDALLKGSDFLELLLPDVPSLFGGLSNALFRRDLLGQCLPLLVQEQLTFSARLDTALFICLLRHGHIAHLSSVSSVERLHAGQLSHHATMVRAYRTETRWLQEILESRTPEPPPAKGWARYQLMKDHVAGEEIVWQEYDVALLFSGFMANLQQQVGTNSLSFKDVYEEWLRCRNLTPAQRRSLPKRIERWPTRPGIVPVILAEHGSERSLQRSLESLDAQLYPPAHIHVLAHADVAVPAHPLVGTGILVGEGTEQLNALVANGQAGDWFLLLRAGDLLEPHALVIMAERMVLRADRACLYFDEGADDRLQASAPIFKPDFNLDLMRSLPYVGRLLAFQSACVRDLGGLDAAFGALAPQDLLWRMVESRGLQVVEHIAELLAQCEQPYGPWLHDPRCAAQARHVVEAHLERLGVKADVSGDPDTVFCRVAYQHADVPGVSILINAGNDLKALMRCVESVFQHTDHANFEVLLGASGEEHAAVTDWLEAMKGLGSDQLRIVSVAPGNPSTRLNAAAAQARGDYLLMLDPGCMLFERQWLNEMMRQAQRPEVGVVGPKLCTRDGRVLGAGLVLGLHGPAGSPFVGHPVDAGGYMGRLKAVQNWTAVSLDCLLVRRSVFEEVGGLETDTLHAGLFDAELCLRVREQGYLTVWTPYAMVARLPASNEPAPDRQKQVQDRDTFSERWLAQLAYDPAYNPNLNLKHASFNLDPGLRSGWNPFLKRVLPCVLGLPVNTTAIGHYRVIHPFSELEAGGWIEGRLDYARPETVALGRENPDVVILQCRYSPSSIDEIGGVRRFTNARRIYELDDYIIEVPKKNEHVRHLPSNMREVVRTCISMCDRVVVSTEPLADALSSMHQDIRVVPNMLAASMWQGLTGRRQTSAKPRVGWAGGTSHRGDLELLVDVVRTLADEVDWVFFGMCPELLRPYIKEFHAGVPLHAYPRKLASLNLDLALAPLEQHVFNDCKSNLRLLEYGACGFPVICSDTKAYQGYLPCTRVADNTAGQWLDAIRMHLTDAAASYRQGDALREAVLRDYVLAPHNLQQWANAWLAD